jgi:hypothetical protein
MLLSLLTGCDPVFKRFCTSLVAITPDAEALYNSRAANVSAGLPPTIITSYVLVTVVVERASA